MHINRLNRADGYLSIIVNEMAPCNHLTRALAWLFDICRQAVVLHLPQEVCHCCCAEVAMWSHRCATDLMPVCWRGV